MALKKTVRGNQRSVNRRNVVTKDNSKSKEDLVQEALTKYHNYLEVEKNYSIYTVQNYLKDIDEFKMFLTKENYGDLILNRIILQDIMYQI